MSEVRLDLRRVVAGAACLAEREKMNKGYRDYFKNGIDKAKKMICVFFVMSGLLISCSKQGDYSLIPVSNDGERWGYINAKGEYVINPQFEDADFFTEDGLAKIKSNGKIGYINKKGEYIIAATYKNGTAFSAGLAFVVAEGGHITCINKANETKFVLNSAKYVSAFKEDLAIFITEDGKFGFVDKTGKVVISAQFDAALPFSEGFARIWQEDLVGFIDKTGKIVISPQFKMVGNFNEDKAPFYDGKQCGYINTKGAYVINPQFDEAHTFSNGLAAIKQGKSWGYINKASKIVINPQFDNASLFSDGLAAVQVSGKFGYINKEGKYEINPQFEYAGDFHNGAALVRSAEKWGLINKKGQYVVNPQFKYVKTIIESEVIDLIDFIESDYYDVSEFINLFFERENKNTFDGINASTTLNKLSEHPIYGETMNARESNYADYRQTIPITKDISICNVVFRFDNTPIFEYTETYNNWGYMSRTKEWNFDATPSAIVYKFCLSGKAYEKSGVVANALKSEIERRYGHAMKSGDDNSYYLLQDNGKLSFAIVDYVNYASVTLHVAFSKGFLSELFSENNKNDRSSVVDKPATAKPAVVTKSQQNQSSKIITTSAYTPNNRNVVEEVGPIVEEVWAEPVEEIVVKKTSTNTGIPIKKGR